MLPGAAKNAPSMARIAILTASLAYIAILTASLVNRAQLAASLAAMFRQHHYDDPTWRHFGSTSLAALFHSTLLATLFRQHQVRNLLHNRWFWRTRDFVAPARCIDVYRLLYHTSSKLVHNSHTILKTVRLYW